MAYLKTAEARIEYRGETAFFGEPDALLPGQGTSVPFFKKCGSSFQLNGRRSIILNYSQAKENNEANG